jgi:hypothetical protein
VGGEAVKLSQSLYLIAIYLLRSRYPTRLVGLNAYAKVIFNFNDDKMMMTVVKSSLVFLRAFCRGL